MTEVGAKKESIIALHDRLLPYNQPTEVFTKACRDYDDGRYFTEWWVREYNEYKVVQDYMRGIGLLFTELEQPTIDMKQDADQLLALLPLTLKEMGSICKIARDDFGMETLGDLEKDWWAEMRQNILPSDKDKAVTSNMFCNESKSNKFFRLQVVRNRWKIFQSVVRGLNFFLQKYDFFTEAKKG